MLIGSQPDGLEDRLGAALVGLGDDSLARSLHILKPGGMLVAFGF